MRPELFKFLSIAFPSYFVLLLTGFIFAGIAAALTTRREGLDPDVMIDLNLAMLLGGVVGARILHVLADGYFWDYVHLCTNPHAVDWKISLYQCLDTSEGVARTFDHTKHVCSMDWSIPQASCADPNAGYLGIWDATKQLCHTEWRISEAACLHPSNAYNGAWDGVKNVCHPKSSDCFAWARFWAGGLTYYGGFIGATAVAIPLLKRDRFPFWKAADYAAIAIPLGLAFGRMGCLLAGCCFGARCDLPWALSFPPGSPASEAQHDAHLIGSVNFPSLPVHPTQVYESAASLAICAFLWFYVNPRKRYDGAVFAWFLGLYAIARFLIEILRRDARGGFLGLSTSQLIGVGLVAAAFALHRRRRNSGEVGPPEDDALGSKAA